MEPKNGLGTRILSEATYCMYSDKNRVAYRISCDVRREKKEETKNIELFWISHEVHTYIVRKKEHFIYYVLDFLEGTPRTSSGKKDVKTLHRSFF